MKARTEELLLVLLWGAEVVTAPTWRNLDSSFESWAYRNGFGRRLEYLAREKLLERRLEPGTREWVYRLTERGRLTGLGGRDPERCWSRPWDGLWQMVLFDLPQRDGPLRKRLWRWLRANGFGYLQNSLWIVPELSEDLASAWPAVHPDVEAFVIFEGRPARGTSDAEVVAGAWDFDEINAGWQRYLVHLDRVPGRQAGTAPRRELLLNWIQQERALWNEVFRRDPLLPERLLPAGYQGCKAWRRRRKIWEKLGRWIRQAQPE